MPEFKKALIKAEQERIKDMQKKEAEKINLPKDGNTKMLWYNPYTENP